MQNLEAELAQARLDGVPEHQRSAVANVRLSIDALAPELRRDFLMLSVVANPLIYPIHGAVVWGLEDEKQWFGDQAHARLELLANSSLLQTVGYDQEHNRAEAYRVQPVIAQVARSLIAAEDQRAARERYARWAALVVDRAYGEGGISYSEEVAQSTQAMLPDLFAALPDLPDAERGSPAWQAAWVFRTFGRPVEAQKLLDLAETAARAADDQPLLGRIIHERAE